MARILRSGSREPLPVSDPLPPTSTPPVHMRLARIEYAEFAAVREQPSRRPIRSMAKESMLIKQRVLTALAVSAVLVLSGCAADTADPGGDDVGVPVVKVGMMGQFTDTPLLVADELGIFDELGLDVEILKFDGVPVGFAAMKAGDVDVMVGTVSSQLLTNVDQPQADQIVQVVTELPGQGLSLIAKDEVAGDVKAQIAALKGKVIGVPALGTDGQLALKRILQYGGLDPETDVSYVALGVGQGMVAAFQNGQIDASMINTPSDALIVQAGGHTVIDLAKDHVIDGLTPWYGGGFMGIRGKLDAKADAVAKFREGITQAIAFINDESNVDEVAAIYSDRAGLALDTAKAVFESRYDAFGATASCDGIQNVYTFMVETGQYDGPAPGCDDLTWAP